MDMGIKLNCVHYKNVVQRPPYGPFDHEDLLWKVVIRHIRMQQGPHFVEVAFIPTTQVLDFIASEKRSRWWIC
jgi:hypothetical protein